MQKITRNDFSKGVNTDVDKQILPPNFATDIQNLELVGDGEFFALRNIAGTTKVEDIINVASTEFLGVFETLYAIDGVNTKCLTIFTATDSVNFKIYCYDTENDNLYTLYTETISGDYLTADRIIDAVRFAENGIDILYFTDYYNEIRQLRCEILDSNNPPTLSEYDLSLQKRGANGIISLTSITTGGSLITGSYQFAYRMVDPDTKRFTKWSSLTNPIHVYVKDGGRELSYAGIGLPSDKKITITIAPTTEETDNFDYFQLAVVENIFPIKESATTAVLLQIEANASLTSYVYSSNTKIGTIPIEDIVVDQAPLETVKTLTAKQNRLMLGNIKYRELEYDNGDPIVTGTVLVQTTDNDLTNPEEHSHFYRGYFRDEVYRFGIVYFDKYGNKSPVKTLDMSGIIGNTIENGQIDMKFPSRDESPGSWTILNSNSKVRNLGLSLTIQNHPSWAIGFEIVRCKRKKKILFQTPVIPMANVEGSGALKSYPSSVYTGVDDTDRTDYTDAKPMTTDNVLVPKNLFRPELRSITKRTSSDTATDVIYSSLTGARFSLRLKGEAIYTFQPTYNYACIFPQPTMYGDEPFHFSGNEKLETIDYCKTKVYIHDYTDTYNDGESLQGDCMKTKITGTFHALDDDSYYFSSGHSKAINDLTNSGGNNNHVENQIVDYAFIDNLGEGVVLGGEKVLQYEELQTEGINSFGYKPNTLKMGVVKLKDTWYDETSCARTFNGYDGVDYDATTNSNVFTTQTLKHEPYKTTQGTLSGGYYTNSLVTEYDGTNGPHNNVIQNRGTWSGSSFVQQIRIVNVVNGEIGDNRYGDVDDLHEFISTGKKYVFTGTEVADNTAIPVDVWGGDCFVSYHFFKVADSCYSITNVLKQNYVYTDKQGTAARLRDKWNNTLFCWPTDANPNTRLMLPVALEKVGQYLQVILESEYNGRAMDYDSVKADSYASVNSVSVLEAPDEASIKTPLTYKYNINLSKQNDQKVYFPKPTYTFTQNDFGARVHYSDQKIYNSDQMGFDTFRVLNFLDLEEKYGNLTKLALGGDQLYAIQQRGVWELPVGVSQIEQTDAGTLSVGTGEVFGRQRPIDLNRGGQHLRGVLETGSTVYVVDNINKAAYALGGQELKNISDMGYSSKFRTLFADTIPENEILSIYDPIRKEIWIAGTDFCHRFNESTGAWYGNYEFPASGLLGGVYTNQKLHLIGKVTDQISAYTMYTGNYNDLFGTSVVPRVTFVVNPDAGFSKTFDNMMFVATDLLDVADATIERENSLGDQTVTGMVLDGSISIEGNYRIKTLRDGNSARLRGTRMIATVKWLTTNVTSTLSSVFTKYRLSSRSPF